jgi:acyl-coenzyme A synthetase/AMP-(fatty) acid ligase
MIYPLTVQAERRADKPAVIHDRPDGATLVWSYAELNRQAHVFRDLGLKPGERFIWCGPNSPVPVRNFIGQALRSPDNRREPVDP